MSSGRGWNRCCLCQRGRVGRRSGRNGSSSTASGGGCGSVRPGGTSRTATAPGGRRMRCAGGGSGPGRGRRSSPPCNPGGRGRTDHLGRQRGLNDRPGAPARRRRPPTPRPAESAVFCAAKAPRVTAGSSTSSRGAADAANPPDAVHHPQRADSLLSSVGRGPPPPEADDGVIPNSTCGPRFPEPALVNSMAVVGHAQRTVEPADGPSAAAQEGATGWTGALR